MTLFGPLAVSLAMASTPLDTTIIVSKPTIVGFIEEPKDGTDSVASDDFTYYSNEVGKRLEEAGVEFQIIELPRLLRIRLDGKLRTLKPKIKIGYYFLAPHRPVRVQYGVMTDDQIVVAARTWLGVKVGEAPVRAGARCAPPNKALHQTRRGGVAPASRRGPVVEARLAGEGRCWTDDCEAP